MSTSQYTGNAIIILPDATLAPWYVAGTTTPGKSKLLTVYHRAASSGTCTIQTPTGSGQKILTSASGVTSTTLAASAALTLRSDGTNWFVL